MRTIKIKFIDFWGDFNPEDNFIINTLREKYICVLSDNPDYLFFSTFGVRNLQYRCVKIMFIGENLSPDFNICDYALGFDHLEYGDRYMRLPLYCVRDNFDDLAPTCAIDANKALDRKFCSIVVSNAKLAGPMREMFFKRLSEYKQVDSGGRLWNNVGTPVADKFEFISRYKFNIAFENSCSPGYVTEKLMDAMTANTLPIYWGDPEVGKDFNTNSFVYVNACKSIDEAVERVVSLDKNDDLYLKMLRAPRTANPSMFAWKKNLLAFLSVIVEKPVEQAKYISDYGMQKLHKRDLMTADFFGNRMKVFKMLAACRMLKEKFQSR